MYNLQEAEKGMYRYASKKYNFVWYDVPKVASSSIRAFLNNYISDYSTIDAYWHVKKRINQDDFDHISKNGFSFAFSRNPWDRMVSLFSYFIKRDSFRSSIIKKNLFYKKKYIPSGKDSFSIFCRNINDIVYPRSFNELKLNTLRQNKNVLANHFLPQLEFIPETTNYIGKVEHAQESINIVCDTIGIQRQKFPHENKTNHKHYTEYYNKETKEIVSKIYARDIEYFGYKFEK